MTDQQKVDVIAAVERFQAEQRRLKVALEVLNRASDAHKAAALEHANQQLAMDKARTAAMTLVSSYGSLDDAQSR